MNEELAKRVRTAAIAGWWTLLIASAFLAFNWLTFVVMSHRRPPWMLSFWGGGEITWCDIQLIWIWMAAIFKVAVWVVALPVIWLSLWARGLRKG